MEILNGKEVSLKIKSDIKERIENDYVSKGKAVPCLACIIVEGNPASEVYVASKEKACMACGMKSIVERIPHDATEDEVISVIEKLNADNEVSAILLQLPLPKGLDERKIVNTIATQKDADGLTDASLGALFSGRTIVAPCTAIGIVHLLEANGIEIEGKNVTVIGRSLLVGKSVANLLEQRNATVTICHSRTRNLAEITRRADIVVVAIGKPRFLTADMVSAGAIIVDVGINRTENGLIGDVDFENVKDKASYITPVPGGVGPMTIAELLSNTLILHEHNHKQEN